MPIVSGDRHPLISGPVPHDFGEAYRSIRTALAAQLPGNGPRIVAVASSQPLEGKTTTAVNIAMALAVGGARVLLIDADMRRPSVHKALRMTNDRGLSQLLAGQARMREVVQRTHDPEPADDHRRPHAGQSRRSCWRRIACARCCRASRPGRSTGSSSTRRRCWR